jgi:hypothetical protein
LTMDSINLPPIKNDTCLGGRASNKTYLKNI